MTLRNATIVPLSIATLAVACVDLSAPKGPASISSVKLPSAFVVRGDVMRDSAGAPALPIVNQFDAAGNPFGGATALFIITDSAPAAHFDATGQLVGDKLGDVHFIGQIGNLQTPSVTVHVTVAPASLARDTSATVKDTILAPVSQDTTVVGSAAMPLVVRGLGDTAVQGVLVRYTLTRTLASNSSTHPAVFFGDNSGHAISVDTTDAAGKTGRVLVKVRAPLLADVAVATGQKVDSIIVQASASYKGTPLGGSPITLVFHVVGTLAP